MGGGGLGGKEPIGKRRTGILQIEGVFVWGVPGGGG